MLVARNSRGIHSFRHHFGGKPCYSWVARISTGIHVLANIFWVNFAIAGIVHRKASVGS